MTFGTARDLSSQVVAIPMTSFGMLMNSPKLFPEEGNVCLNAL